MYYKICITNTFKDTYEKEHTIIKYNYTKLYRDKTYTDYNNKNIRGYRVSSRSTNTEGQVDEVKTKWTLNVQGERRMKLVQSNVSAAPPATAHVSTLGRFLQ